MVRSRGDIAIALRLHPALRHRLRPRELRWATCDDCGSRSVLARATEDGQVYDGSRGVCLECGSVLVVSLDVETRPEWSVAVLDHVGWEPVRVSPVALAAARRVAGWPRETWWVSRG